MQELKKTIYKYGVIPVVTIDAAKDAAPLAQALCDGGLEIAEITFRTDAAADAIAAISAKFPNMLLGAGSILNPAQAELAISKGAKFIVSPGFSKEVVEFCQKRGVLVIPGCATASEVQEAVACGLDLVKFFPAEASGGLKAVQALGAVFGGVSFIPTGGISLDMLSPYLRDQHVWACGVSAVAPRDLIAKGDFAAITRLAKDAVAAALNFGFTHFGINCDTSEEGYKNIFFLADKFNLILGDTESSTYVGREIEITKMPFKVRGPHGHIGYYTDNLERAIFYLGKTGVEFNDASIKPYNGKTYVIYLKELVAGFAVHIEERNSHNPPAWEHRDVVKQRIGWKD